MTNFSFYELYSIAKLYIDKVDSILSGVNGDGTTNGDKPSDGNSNKNTPGFEFLFVFLSLIFVSFFFSKKFSKKR